ncbi:centrosomal protein of 72 kDa isoform X4 [Fukomys damarensis]|uniref:centrosomal protein of 72 kDa isoform X4 n=1 Tax=Fukomys damarensis TaxID=885580 RepID=UPI00053F72BD|nr:centrosomal protein of 72 kDa isoform X4 [Fukomys damarensis]
MEIAELQSLSIRGTYQEQITHLGSSLMHLTGLKSLDLSRNSLVSLEGIQYLVSLESLNLYYNYISSLAEVFRLYTLPELQDVDLRLNPVVKNEPDYQLFVLHVLPRIQQLDDRLVRKSERRASQLRFALADSFDSKESLPAAFKVGRSHHFKVKCADASVKKCLLMDAADEAVLNLIAECEWDLNNPPRSMSSSQEREVTFHHTQESRHLLNPPSFQHQCGDLVRRGHDKKRAGSSTCFLEQLPPHQPCGDLPLQHGEPEACCAHGPHICTSTHPDSTDIEDSSSSKPNLSSQKPPSTSHLAAPTGKRAPLEVVLLEALLDLVDKHWSGCRSLHRNEMFLAQARHVLSSVQELAAAQGSAAPGDVEVSYLALENQSLHTQLSEQQQQYTATMSKVTAELSSTQQEMDTLRQCLDRSLEENNSLKSLVFNMKKEVKNGEMSAALNVQISGLQTSVQQLCGEVVELKQHLEHYDKIQELTQMLQESHRIRVVLLATKIILFSESLAGPDVEGPCIHPLLLQLIHLLSLGQRLSQAHLCRCLERQSRRAARGAPWSAPTSTSCRS